MSATFDVSDVARLRVKFFRKLDSGAELLTDPSAITCRVKDPLNVIVLYTFGVDPELERITVGVFKLEIPVPIVGVWEFRWKGTGAVAVADEQKFTVEASTFPNP